MMFPDKTYLVRFVHRDGNVELVEHNTYDDAETMCLYFDESDADIYTEIQLIERDWTKDEDECDTILHRRTFADQFGKEE